MSQEYSQQVQPTSDSTDLDQSKTDAFVANRTLATLLRYMTVHQIPFVCQALSNSQQEWLSQYGMIVFCHDDLYTVIAVPAYCHPQITMARADGTSPSAFLTTLDMRENGECLRLHLYAGNTPSRYIGFHVVFCHREDLKSEEAHAVFDDWMSENAFWEDVCAKEERALKTNRLLIYHVARDDGDDYCTSDAQDALDWYRRWNQEGRSGVRLTVDIILPETLEWLEVDCLIGEQI